MQMHVHHRVTWWIFNKSPLTLYFMHDNHQCEWMKRFQQTFTVRSNQIWILCNLSLAPNVCSTLCKTVRLTPEHQLMIFQCISSSWWRRCMWIMLNTSYNVQRGKIFVLLIVFRIKHSKMSNKWLAEWKRKQSESMSEIF